MILVRDRRGPFHPIVGIAALGSSIVQIHERDQWIGWHAEGAPCEDITAAPTLRIARWIVHRLEQGSPSSISTTCSRMGCIGRRCRRRRPDSAIARLEQEAVDRRATHHRFVRRSDFKKSGAVDWHARAESDLFRSKRCLAFADLLRARLALDPFLYPKPTTRGLKRRPSRRQWSSRN